jgi:hypothetical protein
MRTAHLTAAMSATKTFNDPGCKEVLVALIVSGSRLQRDVLEIVGATHARPGHEPGSHVPKPDKRRALRAISALHRQIRVLKKEIGAVKCATWAGRKGQADMVESLTTFDTALAAFETALHTSDASTEQSHTALAEKLNRRAAADAKSALALLER